MQCFSSRRAQFGHRLIGQLENQVENRLDLIVSRSRSPAERRPQSHSNILTQRVLLSMFWGRDQHAYTAFQYIQYALEPMGVLSDFESTAPWVTTVSQIDRSLTDTIHSTKAVGGRSYSLIH